MTLEEACRLIDPATDLDALAEIEYFPTKYSAFWWRLPGRF